MRLTATVYRALDPRWSYLPESGEGAAKTGGRFNPAGLPALYTSLRYQTAWLEAQQGFLLKAQPMTMCAYKVDCDDVLDLTKADVLSLYSIRGADLACPWKAIASQGQLPPTWEITHRLMANGVAGIIVPSFAVGSEVEDNNVVFWMWSSDLPHQVRVIDHEDRLPKDASSWS